MKTDLSKLNMVLMDNDQFETFKSTMLENGIDMSSEDIAMTCILDDKPWVIINQLNFNELDEDMRHITIAHEGAHATGILDEEDADRWALDVLTDNQKDILIENWNLRHGHEY